MNLQEFYRNIPEHTAPKSEWITSTAKKLGVSEATVRTWVYGKNKPRDPELIKKLARITSISEEDLFD